MENYIDSFAYIKTLQGFGAAELFQEGMQTNYNLETGKDCEKFAAGAKWVERPASDINNLPTGTMFIGVSKNDSSAREYIVIGKTDNMQTSVWYPINGPEEAEPVITIWKYDYGKSEFEMLFRAELSSLQYKVKTLCEPGNFYMSTDVNGYILPVFGVYNQPDDDDWTDDEDEDDDLDDDEKEVMRALHNITSDDDEDDEDEDNFDQSDCLFTVIKIGDTMHAVTLARGLMLDDEMEDQAHIMKHLEEDLKSLQKRMTNTANEITELETLNETFKETYSKFLSAQKPNMKSVLDGRLVKNDIEDAEVVEEIEDRQPIPVDPDEVEEVQAKEPEMTKEEAALNKQLAEATGIPESETRVEIRVPKNDDNAVVHKTAITEAYEAEQKRLAEEQADEERRMEESLPTKEDISDAVETIGQMATAINSGDTDGETEGLQPTNYSDNLNAEPVMKPKQDFGDW